MSRIRLIFPRPFSQKAEHVSLHQPTQVLALQLALNNGMSTEINVLALISITCI